MYRASISLYTDGACDNTGSGPAGRNTGGGAVILVGSEYRVLEATHGEEGTSNVAEWLAMFRGLVLVRKLVKAEFKEPGATIVVRTDSMLVVKQMNRDWIVGDKLLAHYFRGCCGVQAELQNAGHHVMIRWVPREENDVADALSKIGRRTPGVKRPSFRAFNTLDELTTYAQRTNYGKRSDDRS